MDKTVHSNCRNRKFLNFDAVYIVATSYRMVDF